jgi:hypothetical protein
MKIIKLVLGRKISYILFYELNFFKMLGLSFTKSWPSKVKDLGLNLYSDNTTFSLALTLKSIDSNSLTYS